MRATVRLLWIALLVLCCGAAAFAGGQSGAGEEKVSLTIWWWGEQEAPGAEKWMADTVKAYQAAHPQVSFQTVLQSTDDLVPAFKTAAAARQGPDIQYFWGGGWALEGAWAGGLCRRFWAQSPGAGPCAGAGVAPAGKARVTRLGCGQRHR